MVGVMMLPPGPDGLRSFELRFGDLASLGLPTDAQVYVEPYVKASSMRFACGTVGSLVPPHDKTLPDIDEGAGVLFRVLVVDEKDKIGRLLAMADRIVPAGDDQQRDALLPLVTEDLKEAIWRLDVIEGSPPRLLINSRYPGLKQRLKDDPLLMGAILPLAVRDALNFVRTEQDEEADWVIKWRRYVVEVAGEAHAEVIFDGEDSGDEQRQEVIDSIEHVCSLLTDRRRYLSRALLHAGSASDA
jgi:hypothetical protein